MTNNEDMNAYATLTGEIAIMHHTERTALDMSDHYRAALDAVINGDYEDAREIVTNMRTDAGDAWRTKMGITFWGE